MFVEIPARKIHGGSHKALREEVATFHRGSSYPLRDLFFSYVKIEPSPHSWIFQAEVLYSFQVLLETTVLRFM